MAASDRRTMSMRAELIKTQNVQNICKRTSIMSLSVFSIALKNNFKWEFLLDIFFKISNFQIFKFFLELSRCVKSVCIRSFSVPHFPAFGLNTVIYRVNLCIQSEYRKMRTRKTSNTNIFHAVPDEGWCIKEYAKFVKNTTFGPWEKMKVQPRKMFFKIPMNARATISVMLLS